MVAVLFNATCKLSPGRARSSELSQGLPWGAVSGILAAHALAISAVHIGSTLLTSRVYGPASSSDVGLICELAAELKPLSAALDVAGLSAFDAVGLTYSLPEPAGKCRNAHSAVGVVLADVRARAEPILTDLELLSATETPEALAERAKAKGRRLVEMLEERLSPQYAESLVRRWSEWQTIERKLVAEVAGAGRAGLIPAEGGGPLDQPRFDAAIEEVLRIQRNAERQFLFARWRSVASIVMDAPIANDGQLPFLRDHRLEFEGLDKLTADVFPHTDGARTPGLLALVQLLRELRALAHREDRLLARGRLSEAGDYHASQVRSLFYGALPKTLREAFSEVDQLSVMPSPAQPTTMSQGDSAEGSVDHPATSRPPESEPPPIPNSAPPLTSVPDPSIQWVAATSCIDEQCKDASAVRRFCKQHRVPTQSVDKHRRLVDWNAYQAAKRAIRLAAEKELDGIDKRRERERRRRSPGDQT